MSNLVGYDRSTGELTENVDIFQKGEFEKAVNEAIENVLNEKAQKAQKQREGLRRKRSSYISPEYGGLNKFIGCFRDSIKDIVPYLSSIECGILITILVKMKQGNGGLLISGKKPMNIEDIGAHIKKGRTKTSEYLNKFTELGVLEEIKVGREKQYRVNPQFHIRGKFPELTEANRFIKLYKTKLEEMIDSLSLSELGFIYKALPICHYSTFKLVHNPTTYYNPTVEEGSEEPSSNSTLELFNREELADYMGVEAPSISRTVSSLSKKGFIMSKTACGFTSYTLHPHIVFPKGTKIPKYIQGICNDFNEHSKEKLRRNKGKKA